jgi:hypothetical protein
MLRSIALVLAMVSLAPSAALAQTAPAWQPWFDPAQLPRFSGTVERYLPAPDGTVDGLLFREGAQVLFPPDIAPALRAAIAEGERLVVYGIRARSAAVVTMLAWAGSEDAEPRWVERPAWPRPSTWRNLVQPIRASGTVRQPLLAANGAVNGALLEDGTVLRLPTAIAATLTERLKPGSKIAVAGHGVAQAGTRALVVEALGETEDALRPLTPAQ